MIDFVIGGVAKSGTSLLAKAMSAHPKCNFSSVKEPAYFCTQSGWVDAGNPTGPTFSGNHQLGEDWYEGLFQTGYQEGLRGEASTVYFEESESVDLLLTENPALKWIVCLREPSARAYSHYWEERKHGLPVGKFALNDSSECPRVKRVLDVSRYEKHLGRILNSFPRDQVLVLIAEELFQDPVKVYAEVCAFLDLPLSVEMNKVTRTVNPGKQPRNRWLARTLVKASKSFGYKHGAGVVGAILRTVKRAISPFAYTHEKYPAISTELGESLWGEYEITRVWVQEILKENKPVWQKR